ncbi:MAG: EthD family reductase [Gammaproteobacteria bacterium]|nr:EthD family reductase [Gammaproteobacteria bacterium]
MFRITITYRNEPGATFNWDYYMKNHLPLAVGTSMRHSGLNFCDADKPVNDDAPYKCVCMVHFDSEQSMRNFCDFFLTEHPESKKIDNDENNYTNVAPEMVVSQCETDNEANKGNYRLKLFFPRQQHQQTLAKVPEEELRKLLDDNASVTGPLTTELDNCHSGLESDSLPDYWFIWVLCFSTREEAEKFASHLSEDKNRRALKQITGVDFELMTSEIMSFDMSLTEPHRVLADD